MFRRHVCVHQLQHKVPLELQDCGALWWTGGDNPFQPLLWVKAFIAAHWAIVSNKLCLFYKLLRYISLHLARKIPGDISHSGTGNSRKYIRHQSWKRYGFTISCFETTIAKFQSVYTAGISLDFGQRPSHHQVTVTQQRNPEVYSYLIISYMAV